MTLPEPLSAEHTARLRALAPPPEPVTGPPPGGAGEPGGATALGRGAARLRAAGVRVPTRAGLRARAAAGLRPARARAAGAVTRVAQREVEPVAGRVEQLTDELAAVRAQLDRLVADRVDTALAERATEANRVNLELLKGEFRALLATVEELGMALAPGTGLAGAGARVAELREAVHALERQVRAAGRTVAPATAAPAPGAPAPAGAAADAQPPAPGGVASVLFDYVGFERRFRGDPEEVLRVQAERYADLLAASEPVLDVGCGRGELLELLAGRGVEVLGVDTDPGMVVEARERGLSVDQADVVAWLRRREPGSLGAIFSAHVAEHLELDVLLEFLELAATRLRPGGVFVAETPNPQSLIVLGNSYILDPTHVRPLHPSLFSFLCESAGFRDVRLAFHSPATGYHLPRIEGDDLPAWAAAVDAGFRRLDEVLFGPQEYAVIATTPPAG